MNRKDCENFLRRARITRMVSLCALAVLSGSGVVQAGQIRLWPTAVVVAEAITIGDLAELRGMASSEEEDVLRLIVVTEAPPAGGSRIIHHEMIRSALSAKGVNLAKLTLAGSAQCEVRRPSGVQSESTARPLHAMPTVRSITSQVTMPQVAGFTLRQAIQEHFDAELSRYGGRAEILFDRSDDALLELSGPPLEFSIRRDKGALLGLVALDVEVAKDGKISQEVRLVVRAGLSRNVLTARRAINQGATVAAADIDLMPVTFISVDNLGTDDAAAAIGQRARRFIPSGTQIELDAFEPVPLVLRGQLITLVSQVGGVRVVTTAKACASGLRSQTIRVRSVDDHKVEFDAIVTGPGEARASGSTSPSAEESKPRLAAGGVP